MDLPPEMWTLILGYLPRLVSHLWKIIIGALPFRFSRKKPLKCLWIFRVTTIVLDERSYQFPASLTSLDCCQDRGRMVEYPVTLVELFGSRTGYDVSPLQNLTLLNYLTGYPYGSYKYPNLRTCSELTNLRHLSLPFRRYGGTSASLLDEHLRPPD